jgi:hypothetical protein
MAAINPKPRKRRGGVCLSQSCSRAACELPALSLQPQRALVLPRLLSPAAFPPASRPSPSRLPFAMAATRIPAEGSKRKRPQSLGSQPKKKRLTPAAGQPAPSVPSASTAPKAIDDIVTASFMVRYPEEVFLGYSHIFKFFETPVALYLMDMLNQWGSR